MKKVLFFSFIFLSFFLFPLLVHAEETSTIIGEQIRKFDSNIKVNVDGTIDIIERIHYDFETLDRHGIYRDIYWTKKNKEGKKLGLDFKVINVTDENNTSYRYTTSKIDDILRIKIGNANTFVTGQHTYVISYKVSGALTYFSDHDELYWNATGNEWPVPITIVKTTVQLPDKIGDDTVTILCYTGPQGSTLQNCTENILNHQVTIENNASLFSKEGLTFVVSFPRGVVAVLEPKPVVDFFDTLPGKIVLAIIMITAAIVGLCWYVIYPIWIPVKWYLHGRDPETGSGQVRAWFDPPKTSTGRFLTPAETGGLVDERVDSRDIFGTIIHLAQRGYLTINEEKKGDFYFIKGASHRTEDKLTSFERILLDGIFDEENEVRIKYMKCFETVKKTSDTIYKSLLDEKYFPENPEKIRTYYNVIAGVALSTFNFHLGIIAFLFGRNMPRKTREGVEASHVGLSLKNFLTSQERQLEFQSKNQLMFEKLLPYAIVFGVEKIWADRFKDIALKKPDWYEGYDSSSRFNSLLFVSALSFPMSSMHSAMTPTTSSSGFSSGFSGGFSGGGGGGGGGGSW